MMRKTGRFEVIDSNGKRYTIHRSTKIHTVDSMEQAAPTETDGTDSFKTADGLNFIDLGNGEYEIEIGLGKTIRVRSV